jgi:hypothetical protein
MENLEKNPNKVEPVIDPEAIEFIRKLGQLRFSYLTNKICLKGSAENLQETLFYLYDGKLFIDIIKPFIDTAEVEWKKLIEDKKLPDGTTNDLKLFSERCSQFIQQIGGVKKDVAMTEQEREEIQTTARSIIQILDRLIALRPD